MEILKKIVSGIFKVILFGCVFLLVLSFSAKEMLQDGISSVVSSNLIQIPGIEMVKVENEKVNEFVQSPEVQEFMMQYVETIMGEEVDTTKINIGKDILEFVATNKEEIEEVTGQPIDMEKLEEFTKSEEMQQINEQYILMVTDAKENVPVEVKNVMQAYSFFLTSKFKILMGIIGAVAIGIIALINKSWYSWLKTVSKVLISCGIVIGLFAFAGTTILSNIFKALDYGNITLEYMDALIVAGVTIVSGIVIAIIYRLIEKRVKENAIANETPAVLS